MRAEYFKLEMLHIWISWMKKNTKGKWGFESLVSPKKKKKAWYKEYVPWSQTALVLIPILSLRMSPIVLGIG